MPTINDVLLGYGGGAKIGDTSVLITGGNLNVGRAGPIINAYKTPLDSAPAHPIILGASTYTFSGTINFDYTLRAVHGVGGVGGFINKEFLKRNHEFDVLISDGNRKYKMEKCKWSSFMVSGAPNSMITGSIAFSSTNGTYTELQPGGEVEYIFDDELLSYWYTGEEEVESFNLSLSQTLTPQFMNGNLTNPTYIRCGFMEASLQVSSWDTWLAHRSINIADKKVRFKSYYSETEDFTYGGQTATGTHSYTIKLFSETNSDEDILLIENR